MIIKTVPLKRTNYQKFCEENKEFVLSILMEHCDELTDEELPCACTFGRGTTPSCNECIHNWAETEAED